jgi:hypothetical protein
MEASKSLQILRFACLAGIIPSLSPASPPPIAQFDPACAGWTHLNPPAKKDAAPKSPAAQIANRSVRHAHCKHTRPGLAIARSHYSAGRVIVRSRLCNARAIAANCHPAASDATLQQERIVVADAHDCTN